MIRALIFAAFLLNAAAAVAQTLYPNAAQGACGGGIVIGGCPTSGGGGLFTAPPLLTDDADADILTDDAGANLLVAQ